MGMKRADLVNRSRTTHMKSCDFWVRCKPTTKLILMSSNFKVGIWICCSKTPEFWWSVFTCWKFEHLATTPLCPFLDLSTNMSPLCHCTFLPNPGELSFGTHVLLLGFDNPTHLHREHTIYLGTLVQHPLIRRMIHSTCREPILSHPLRLDKCVVLTSPYPLEITRSYDELKHLHPENFHNSPST